MTKTIVKVFSGQPADIERSVSAWCDEVLDRGVLRTYTGEYLYHVIPSPPNADGTLSVVVTAQVAADPCEAALLSAQTPESAR